MVESLTRKGRHPKLDLANWIEMIVEDELSIQQLRNRITRAHSEERRVEPLVEEKNGVLHFKVRKLHLEKMSAAEKAAAVGQLEAALTLLKA